MERVGVREEDDRDWVRRRQMTLCKMAGAEQNEEVPVYFVYNHFWKKMLHLPQQPEQQWCSYLISKNIQMT